MIIEWIINTFLIAACIYLSVMMFYYKTLLEKEKAGGVVTKNTLGDSEIIIRKYQVQLQRALGNIDILTDELSNLKSDQKSLRTRNAQYRMESDKLRQEIKDLEAKIEALL